MQIQDHRQLKPENPNSRTVGISLGQKDLPLGKATRFLELGGGGAQEV